MIDNNARFKKLDLEIGIGINEYYDLGFVNSIEECFYGVNKQHKVRGKYREENSTKGMHHAITEKESGKKIVYIYYLDQNAKDGKKQNSILLKYNTLNSILPKYDTLITRIHQEIHAISALGKINFLSDLLKQQKREIRLENIADEELIARIGSIYALKKLYKERDQYPYEDKIKEYTSSIIELYCEKDKLFNEAFKIYTDSKISKKTTITF